MEMFFYVLFEYVFQFKKMFKGLGRGSTKNVTQNTIKWSQINEMYVQHSKVKWAMLRLLKSIFLLTCFWEVFLQVYVVFLYH